jgi:flagellar protein FlaJ
MTFTAFLQRLRGKASSRAEGDSGRNAVIKRGLLFDPDASTYDLLTVLNYLSCLATAKVGRDQLFEAGAALGYGPSPYFAQVANLVQSLGYDYAEACYVVAQPAEDEVIRNFLLRFGNSMASGEEEATFLERETHVAMEDYTNGYERNLETLRKWADAFVALMVSANLIVLVALISNMIYNMGSMFLLLIEVVVIATAALGGYLIYRIAPFDPVVHRLRDKAPEQRLMLLLGRMLLPAAALAALLVYILVGVLGVALIVAALLILPVGVLTQKLESKIDSRDRDIADFLRSLGSVAAARGSTVIDSLKHIDQRAIGSLESELVRLLCRVAAGIQTSRAWARFIGETGSDLIHRVVRAFWDASDHGGDTEKIGRLCGDMALRVYLLRAKRKLVSSTFTYVVIPMHIALVGVMVFISEVVTAFNEKLLQAQAFVSGENTTTLNPKDIGIPEALAFQEFDTGFIKLMVLMVILALTLVNAFAPRAASGGHNLKIALFAAATMFASGVVLLLVPPMAAKMFSDTLSEPLQ